MAMSQEELTEWFQRGLDEGATHMIVVCDTYDWDDFPVYVMPGEDARKKAFEYGVGKELPTGVNSNMSKVMEVYSLKLPLEDQRKEHRAFHFD